MSGGQVVRHSPLHSNKKGKVRGMYIIPLFGGAPRQCPRTSTTFRGYFHGVQRTAADTPPATADVPRASAGIQWASTECRGTPWRPMAPAMAISTASDDTVERPTGLSTERPADTSTAEPAERPTDTPTATPADTSTETPTTTSAERPTDTSAETHGNTHGHVRGTARGNPRKHPWARPRKHPRTYPWTRLQTLSDQANIYICYFNSM